MGEGQEDEYRWYCAGIQGIGDCCFESKQSELLIGELPHTLRVRKICRLQGAARKDDPTKFIPVPSPWVALMTGAVEQEEEITVNSASVVKFALASRKFGLMMAEMWKNATKPEEPKSKLHIVESEVPKKLKG